MKGHSGKPIDGYTLAHLGTGALLGASGVPAAGALAMSVFWELAEQPMKRRLPHLFPIPELDTKANSFFDTFAWMTGWALAAQARAKRPLMTFKETP